MNRNLLQIGALVTGILFAAGGTWAAWQGFREVSVAMGKKSIAISTQYRRIMKRGFLSRKLNTVTFTVDYQFLDEHGATNSVRSDPSREDPMKAGPTVRYSVFPSFIPMLESEFRRTLRMLGIVGGVSLALLGGFLWFVSRLSDPHRT
jgi:hypothetical protein